MNDNRINKTLTAQPVEAGTLSEYPREWGRTDHVYQQFGIKRGTLYNLHADGLVKGKVVRARGELKGIRLWNMDSIRRFIESQTDSFESSCAQPLQPNGGDPQTLAAPFAVGAQNKNAPTQNEPRRCGILPNVNFSFSA